MYRREQLARRAYKEGDTKKYAKAGALGGLAVGAALPIPIVRGVTAAVGAGVGAAGGAAVGVVHKGASKAKDLITGRKKEQAQSG